MHAPRPVTLPRTEVHTLHSERVGADFEIWIAAPAKSILPTTVDPPRLLYLLDANLYFGTAVEMTRLMHMLYGELPPVLVVGIAYDTDDPAVQSALRSRDFTPTADSGFAAMAPRLPTEPADQPSPPLGGAPNFLAFLRDELQPWVGANYETAPGGAMLFGSSLGGLFSLYAFLEAPELFDHFAAVSPALWWDDAMLLTLATEYAGRTRNAAPELFLAAGGNEERPEIPMLAQFKMITNMLEMANRLRRWDNRPGAISADVLEGETHTSVVPVALSRALRAAYSPRRDASGPDA